MTHIAFIIPNASIRETVHEAWTIFEKIFGTDHQLTYSVYVAIQPDAIDALNIQADIFVSRGGTAAELKKKKGLKPVVEIPITTNDIMTSIRLSAGDHPEGPIAVVGTVNTIRSVLLPQSNLPVEIKPYLTASVQMKDLINGMEAAINDGCKLIMAGNQTTRYCQEHGIPCGLIVSSVESVFMSIIEAKRCADVSWVERENSLIFRSVIDHVS